ncbi:MULTISPECIES: 4-hydroxy-tetrahydrodipicolinate synthase [Bacteria]|jgi:4-hydroxy-tetrahydrodipicolinate synthase|uniref:4-hydroxy-tetrahydrodipicolinate synthase n=7 Tax=Bacteria TaxID=2 RepID=DAPA_CUTAK|nr:MULTISPECIES: 4-hydroxy-tetrahydrodipicolinate synthase [Bacteria]Q6AA18.1 RecName: Full=4-hydroxy-tetrahydrodipicolinate synthase; Short=HTPA synthase [Cutibacterium acnes KPA171202]EGL46542.1 dihydrodipicolinate synthase [Propionibacterium sp. 409-HC1]EGR90580.1 dihydrodipicolinate synthase [Propionibacterium sp. CC003-HC2]EHC26100.1 dihydrodipicolinate synthase [Propionibacterium sp. 5_U_42AFAA]ERS19769.1 dihydrodipicolinate synthase [Propionibacterium sp. KPL2009]ERS21140.1 dihydrodipi
MSAPVFGRLLTAMVTPMTFDGAVDLRRTGELAHKLVEEQNNDGIVVNGTTGESPTTTDSEKAEIVKAVVEAVGSDAAVVAGVGTNDTAHTIELAHQAAEAGADGLLVVTPYYSKPSQAGIIEHFTAVADATDLPIMLYDIPGRTGTPIETKTLIELADHARIVAVKDAKGLVVESATVMASTTLAYYSGDDAITPALLSVGGVGLVGTSTHFTGRRMHEVIDAYVDGRIDEALSTYREILPVLTGVFAAQGATMVKAGLAHQGFTVGRVRPPQTMPTPEQAETFFGVLDRTQL